MCDEQTLKDWEKYLKNKKPVSRRTFNTLTAGAGIAAVLPSVASAQVVPLSSGMVEIRTPDGIADCYMANPSEGASAGILIWPDILGLRPAFKDMARRLARSGYAVLVVNPFYRTEKSPVVEAGARFEDPRVREKVISLARTLSTETHFTDARAFVDYLDAHDSVSPERKIGTMGFCMGGPMVMRTAAARSARIGAAATFHGGGLATAAEDSPHLLIPEMKADFLIAIAENDDMSDPQAKITLRDSFAAAKLNAEIEVYDGAAHGWTVSDSTVYHEEQAAHAWDRMMALFETALA